jgi:hypothetical protein
LPGPTAWAVRARPTAWSPKRSAGLPVRGCRLRQRWALGRGLPGAGLGCPVSRRARQPTWLPTRPTHAETSPCWTSLHGSCCAVASCDEPSAPPPRLTSQAGQAVPDTEKKRRRAALCKGLLHTLIKQVQGPRPRAGPTVPPCYGRQEASPTLTGVFEQRTGSAESRSRTCTAGGHGFTDRSPRRWGVSAWVEPGGSCWVRAS